MENSREEIVVKKLKNSAKIQLALGIVMVIWNGIWLMGAMMTLGGEDIAMDIFVTIFFVIWLFIGVFLIYIYYKKNKAIGIFNDYKIRCRGNKLAYEQKYRELSVYLKLDENTVLKDMKLLKQYKLWEWVYGGQSIVEAHEEKQMKSEISLMCHSCGSTNKININDKSAICSCCGTPLKEELLEALILEKQ